MNYLIRKLVESDYDQFILLLNDFRTTSFTKEDFVSNLNKMINSDIWVIELEGSLIASATIIYETKFIHNICKSAHIEDVVTKKEFRGQGFGKILINHLVEQAKINLCYKVNLVCLPDVSHFYSSCGFENKGQHMVYLVSEN